MDNVLHPAEMAQALYNLCCDMDYRDYEETNEKELQELENAFYQLKAICDNEMNFSYWRTLYSALSIILNQMK